MLGLGLTLSKGQVDRFISGLGLPEAGLEIMMSISLGGVRNSLYFLTLSVCWLPNVYSSKRRTALTQTGQFPFHTMVFSVLSISLLPISLEIVESEDGQK